MILGCMLKLVAGSERKNLYCTIQTQFPVTQRRIMPYARFVEIQNHIW